jgi:organic hydroperoxide reductase OsmC/OhrA
VPPTHRYRARVRWTGDRGEGTRAYTGYGREHEIELDGKPTIPGSSGIGANADRGRANPEELLVAALSACHMLWYLHLCAEAGVVVTGYVDDADGEMATDADGAGRFVRATLRPRVTIAEGAAETATSLHAAAHAKCYIASSVNFPVDVVPSLLRAVPGRPPTG